MRLDRPQRLTPPAAPGALLKRPFGIAPRVRIKEVTEHDPAYLALIRQCPCLHCMMEPCEAAHVRMQSGLHNKHGGAGKKPSDKWALPLCSAHHRDQHAVGEREFWNALGIDPLSLCEKLYAARGDLVAMRAVCLVAIGERGR